jgi:hypothetical protein
MSANQKMAESLETFNTLGAAKIGNFEELMADGETDLRNNLLALGQIADGDVTAVESMSDSGKSFVENHTEIATALGKSISIGGMQMVTQFEAFVKLANGDYTQLAVINIDALALLTKGKYNEALEAMLLSTDSGAEAAEAAQELTNPSSEIEE